MFPTLTLTWWILIGIAYLMMVFGGLVLNELYGEESLVVLIWFWPMTVASALFLIPIAVPIVLFTEGVKRTVIFIRAKQVDRKFKKVNQQL